MMAMNLQGSGTRAVRPVMNVTPLVDVVLVLLIIFMVVTPLLNKQFWVHVPEPKKDPAAEAEPDRAPLVLTVQADGTLLLNKDAVPAGELAPRLRRVFAARPDHTLFFKASDRTSYGAAVEALDLAREGGAAPIAVLTEPDE